MAALLVRLAPIRLAAHGARRRAQGPLHGQVTRFPAAPAGDAAG